MPNVLIVGAESARYMQLLQAENLPHITFSIFPDVQLAKHAYGLIEIILGPPDAVVPLLPLCDKLGWVQSSWAGVKPLVRAARRDYQLTGVKDVFGPRMSEFVMGWLLALERNIVQRAGRSQWDNTVDSGLTGKTLGIMGTGSIGTVVAETALVFGLQIRGMNSTGEPSAPFQQCYAIQGRIQFAQGLDYLVALLPDTPATDGIVNQQLLAALKPGAIFINGGRANCVDDGALVSALDNGQLRAAVLDVVHTEPLPDDDSLWQVDNLYISSHTAAPTPESSVVALFAENYRRYIDGKPLLHLINFDRGY
jgi:phosphoglycerate dehydrogenase-like enzyme